jgi:ketosteroid isomerase-like protein
MLPKDRDPRFITIRRGGTPLDSDDRLRALCQCRTSRVDFAMTREGVQPTPRDENRSADGAEQNGGGGGETMNDLQAIADRVEIETLRGEYADAVMMHDYDRFASLFTEDAAMRWPHISREFVGREAIRAAIEQGQSLWDYFVQTTHPGTIQVEGDTATGRAYIAEFGRLSDGSSHLNYAVYHDRYERTPDGWKFAERLYEIRYVDPSPLAGSAPHATSSS